MHWMKRYLISLLPLVSIGSTLYLSEWAFKEFGCRTYGKEFLHCQAYGVDINLLLGIGMYWCKILLPVVWFISVPWFLYVVFSQIETWWKDRHSSRV
jgi:hypothetical protein